MFAAVFKNIKWRPKYYLVKLIILRRIQKIFHIFQIFYHMYNFYSKKLDRITWLNGKPKRWPSFITVQMSRLFYEQINTEDLEREMSQYWIVNKNDTLFKIFTYRLTIV